MTTDTPDDIPSDRMLFEPATVATDAKPIDVDRLLLDTPEARAAYIEDILQAAVMRAVTFIRAQRPGRGEYELVRALLRVARITGDQELVDHLEQYRYYDVSAKGPRVEVGR